MLPLLSIVTSISFSLLFLSAQDHSRQEKQLVKIMYVQYDKRSRYSIRGGFEGLRSAIGCRRVRLRELGTEVTKGLGDGGTEGLSEQSDEIEN